MTVPWITSTTDAPTRAVGGPGGGAASGKLAFGRPAVIVDTHVTRVTARLGFTTQKDPDKIEMDLRASGLTEIPSSRIGAAAMDALRSIDQIAYIRFASVYQSFEDLEDLKREVDTLYAQRGNAGAAPE